MLLTVVTKRALIVPSATYYIHGIHTLQVDLSFGSSLSRILPVRLTMTRILGNVTRKQVGGGWVLTAGSVLYRDVYPGWQRHR